MRQTSIETYQKIMHSGLLPKRRRQVYDYLYHKGPKTAAEVFQALGMKTNQSGRFTELEKHGVIQQVGTKEDSITGMKVTLWDVTSNLPVPISKPKSKADIKKQVCDMLMEVYKNSGDDRLLKGVGIIEGRL